MRIRTTRMQQLRTELCYNSTKGKKTGALAPRACLWRPGVSSFSDPI